MVDSAGKKSGSCRRNFRLYEEEYESQRSLLKEDEKPDEKEPSRRSEDALEENWNILVVDNLSDVYSLKGYEPVQTTGISGVSLYHSLPYIDNQWYDILSNKLFEELTVDVRPISSAPWMYFGLKSAQTNKTKRP